MSEASSDSTPKAHPTQSGIKRQFAWSVAPILVTTVLNLASVPLYIRYLGDELYALLGFVAVFTGMFGFADMGLGVAVGRYIGLALGKGDATAVREYWGTGNSIAVPIVGGIAILFSIIGAIFSPHWFSIESVNIPLLRACFIAGGFTLFFNFYGQFWLILSQAHLDFRFIGMVRSTAQLFLVVVAVIIAWLTRDPVLVTAWGAVVAAAQLGAYVWHARKVFGLGFELQHARRTRAHEMAAYTGKTFVILVLGNLFGSIDRFVLGRLTPKEGTAFVNYTNCAANIGVRLQSVGAAIMGPVFHNTNRALGRAGPSSAATIYNETFDFVIGWYVLAGVWSALWHPVFLRAWLGAERGAQVEPLFTPVVIAFCLTAIAGISNAQLSSLNRMGTVAAFTVGSGILAAAGVLAGWHVAGIEGAAYGFLFSRVALVAQDIYTIRLIRAEGWLAWRTWTRILKQLLLGGVLAAASLMFPRQSLWLLIPAAVHGGVAAAWMARHQIRKHLSNLRTLGMTAS